jgi:hypothetical protein
MNSSLIEFQHRPETEQTRRIAFMIARAAHDLGVNLPSSLPMDARLDCILQAAMDAPADIDPDAFKLVYALRGC